MAKLRVLVVDDQHEVRRVLTTGIRTLGENLEVIDVPSGEEAHLEAIRHPVDLLVVDMRLPGISGLELVHRIRRRKPDVHVILVTGLEESSVRRQMTEAEADAFFYKPIHMADFLNAVEHSLGLKDEGFVSPPVGDEPTIVPPPPSVKWISDLRQALDALAVILFDIVGQVDARAGELPDPSLEDEWLKVISTILSANAKLSHQIKAPRPSGFWYLDGTDYHLCVAHLGKSHAALVVAKKPLKGEQFQAIQEYSKLLDMDVQALTIAPDEMAALPLLEEAQEEEVKIEDIPLEDLPLEDLPELDALFSQGAPALASSADSFWDDLSGKEAGLEGAFGPKTLTYEQAMKLGLAPGEEEKQEK
jgi:two-component system response regulator (stage 0 sporulation protein F)